MAKDQLVSLDFKGTQRLLNLPDAATDQEAATYAQLKAAIEGIKNKDPVVVATQSNINLAAPGATIDSVTMAAGDEFLARVQTSQPENGVYVWNGPSTPATRSLKANTGTELVNAVVPVIGGTSAGITYRQTAGPVTIGTTNIVWTVFGGSAGMTQATETSLGGGEIATQAEVDAGSDDLRILTALKHKNSVYSAKRVSQNIGDGFATSFTVTHNFNSKAVDVKVFRNSGNFDEVGVEVRRNNVNSVDVLFQVAPTSNQFTVIVTY